MQLTPEQQHAVDAFGRLYRGEVRRLKLGGYAGTGKTTIVRAILDRYGARDIAVCAPTGKAAHVLRCKGVDACTLHSLIYMPRGVDDDGQPVFGRTRTRMPRVVIVDEASMLSTDLVRDLEAIVRHVFYVGDHGQLEPIGDDPGLMSSLDIRLETIHRQATDSPILDFAHHVRMDGEPKSFGPAARVQDGWSKRASDLVDFDVVLVGYNRTRVSVNAWMRKYREFTSETDMSQIPKVGEVVICLRNYKHAEVWNGMRGIVTEIDPVRRRMSVDTDDGPREGLLFRPEQFGKPTTLPWTRSRRPEDAPTYWDHGYALTCHKFQGSEAERVAVVEEIAPSWSASRWRYTAATRASKELRWILK